MRGGPRRYPRQIRRWARYANLVAHKSRTTGYWYLSDADNWLASPECGLCDSECIKWLLS